MLWLRSATWLCVILLFTGCGFRPLYGTHGTVNVSDELARVEVAQIPDRIGQQVRNGLLTALAPRGPSESSVYVLSVALTEGISALAVKKSAFATRANFRLTARYSLTERTTGRTLFNGSSTSTSAFNILDSEFATLMAENGAKDRAIKDVVEDIRNKLAVAVNR